MYTNLRFWNWSKVPFIKRGMSCRSAQAHLINLNNTLGWFRMTRSPLKRMFPLWWVRLNCSTRLACGDNCFIPDNRYEVPEIRNKTPRTTMLTLLLKKKLHECPSCGTNKVAIYSHKQFGARCETSPRKDLGSPPRVHAALFPILILKQVKQM